MSLSISDFLLSSLSILGNLNSLQLYQCNKGKAILHKTSIVVAATTGEIQKKIWVGKFSCSYPRSYSLFSTNSYALGSYKGTYCQLLPWVSLLLFPILCVPLDSIFGHFFLPLLTILHSSNYHLY